MVNISSLFIPAAGESKDRNKLDNAGAAAGFDALLASATQKVELTTANSKQLFDVAGLLLDSISASRTSPSAADILGLATEGGFAFSSAFEHTFGLTGPLPNYIARITKELELSKEQNLALQNIAIDNKDITKTDENVAKIARQLEEAGIRA